MNLTTVSFRLELVPLGAMIDEGTVDELPGTSAVASPSGAPTEDAAATGWARVRVCAEVHGFRADFVARTQLESLRRFARELEAMQEADARAGRATLTSDEPGIDLRLDAQEDGGIAGHFALESPRRSGAWTTLSGTFEFEAAGLAALQASVGELLRRLEEGTRGQV